MRNSRTGATSKPYLVQVVVCIKRFRDRQDGAVLINDEILQEALLRERDLPRLRHARHRLEQDAGQVEVLGSALV